MTFADLLAESAGMGAGEQQAHIRSRLPTRAQERGMRMRKPGDAIPSQGRRFLIGITEIPRDLILLDSVCATSKGDQLDVFILSQCKSQSEIEDFVADIGPVYHSPVVGVWTDGRLNASASGWKNAGDLLAGYGITLPEDPVVGRFPPFRIMRYLWPWSNA